MSADCLDAGCAGLNTVGLGPLPKGEPPAIASNDFDFDHTLFSAEFLCLRRFVHNLTEIDLQKIVTVMGNPRDRDDFEQVQTFLQTFLRERERNRDYYTPPPMRMPSDRDLLYTHGVRGLHVTVRLPEKKP